TTPILTRRDLIHAEIDGESTEISALAGLRRPDLLLLNDDDLGYAKVRLDDTSLTTVMAHPHAIVDSLARAVVLGSLWDMTRDAALPARTFINIGLQFLADDLDSTLRRSLISQITTTAKMYVAPHTRDTTTIELGDKLAELANNAQPGSDAQLQLVTAAATWATTDTQLERIRALLDGTQTLPGLDIDTEMRWTLLTSLAAGGRATVEEIAAEEEKDRTATGRERGARARASIPTAEAKEAAWARAIEEDSLPNSMIEATAQGFVRANDLSLLTPYIPRYHAMLRDIERTRTHAITESIVEAFYPAVLASRELLEATQTWLEANTDAPDALLRLVNERRDVAARALAAQERDAQS
ncbi:ERAP1-like C-terminal domain-containing protein, partial [Dermatophilus congolensis]